jgi:hypothetical protein
VFKQKKLIALALLGLLLLTPLGGCQTLSLSRTTASAGTRGATFCQVAKPFYWSKKDTRMTQEQAVSHNSVFRTLCGDAILAETEHLKK